MKTINYTTPTPNILFDQILSHITEAELKVLLVIIRQTAGWYIKRTGKRKKYDQITISYFEKKTGLSRKAISTAIEKLIIRKYVKAYSGSKVELTTKSMRRGQKRILYTCCLQQVKIVPTTSEQRTLQNGNNCPRTKEILQRKWSESQGSKRLSDQERYEQIQRNKFQY